MQQWIGELSDWTGIDPDTLVALLIFVLIVALIVAAFVVVGLVLVLRPGPNKDAERRRASERRSG